MVGPKLAKRDGDIHEQINQMVLELDLLEANLFIGAVLLGEKCPDRPFPSLTMLGQP